MLIRQITILLLCYTLPIMAEQNPDSLKQRAINEFKHENYDRAIELLETALPDLSDDPEIYYYLGFFNHYRAYDSRPLSGYDYAYSQRIFTWLAKAIELNPDYGNARYFYGAECSANAFREMQAYRADSVKYYYQKAYNMGAYPDWLLEFGRNILATCDKNAIYFAGGNPDFDVCTYLQLHENYRRDITIIPIGFIDRPWYVKYLKDGLPDVTLPINISLSDTQIMDIHPYKWRKTTINIKPGPVMLKKYNLPDSTLLSWELAPDLTSDRMHSKIQGEKARPRQYLSPQRAVLLRILEDNFALRPIYFSTMANPAFLGGLDDYCRNCGLVQELSPLKTMGTELEYDYKAMEQIIHKANLKDYQSIATSDLPRISGLTAEYYKICIALVINYKSKKETDKISVLRKIFDEHLKTGTMPEYEAMLQRVFDE